MPSPLKTIVSSTLLVATSLSLAVRADGRGLRDGPPAHTMRASGAAPRRAQTTTGSATREAQGAPRLTPEKLRGVVESVDLEKGLVFVSLGAPETRRLVGVVPGFREALTARGMWGDWSPAAGLIPEARSEAAASESMPAWRSGTIVAVRVSEGTRLKVEPELEGTLMPVRKGAPVEVDGTVARAEPGADEALVMNAARITVRSSACVPEECHKSGSCKRKCGTQPCGCAK